MQTEEMYMKTEAGRKYGYGKTKLILLRNYNGSGDMSSAVEHILEEWILKKYDEMLVRRDY